MVILINKMKPVLRINLLEGSEARRRKKDLKITLRNVIFGLLAFWLVVFLFNILVGVKIKALKAEKKKIEKEWKQNQFLLTKKEYFLNWQQGFKGIFSFLETTFKRDYLWSDILARFSNLTPEEIWFREIRLENEKGRKFLEIKASVGYLEDNKGMLKEINSFVNVLGKDSLLSSYLGNVGIKNLKRNTADEKREVMDFSLSFSLKK